MHCHCGTNNRAPRWTFTDPCKPEVRPGAREVSASPAWLAAPVINAHDTTKVYIWMLDTGCGPTLHVYRKCHSHNTPGKGIITLESNPSRATVLPAPHDKGNKCDKNIKYKLQVQCTLKFVMNTHYNVIYALRSHDFLVQLFSYPSLIA